MRSYEEALFEAFAWSQAVEENVRDLVTNFFPEEYRQKARQRKYGPTLGELIEILEPHVGDELADKLHGLREQRNEVVHRSNYVKNILDWSGQADLGQKEVLEEIQRFKGIKILAGDLFGELLDVPDMLAS